MKTQQTISKFFKIFLISGLYLSFFAVQLFFNFDLANSQKNRTESYAFNNLSSGNNSHTYSQKPSIASKANIRLNKRFEPKSFADCITPVTEICTFFHTPEKLGFCYEENILSSIKLSALLRGPPSVA